MPGGRWKFELCETLTLRELGPLTQGRSRNLDVIRNTAGNFKCNVPLTSWEAEKIYSFPDKRGTIRHSIKAKRNGQTIWSGPIYTLKADLPANNLEINCVGWLEELVNRELRQDFNFSASTPTFQIVSQLLDHVNTIDPDHPTFITMGSFFGVDTDRTANFTKGQKLLDAIMSLSTIESGFDLDIDPETRELNLYAWDNYDDRTDIQCGYNWGPNNLANVNIEEDASLMRNRFVVTGSAMTTPAEVPGPGQPNPEADDFWLAEETRNLGEVGKNETLLAYAGAEVALLGRPFVTYTLLPKSGQDSFRPFDSFNLGDKIYFSAHKGAIKIQKQAIRVFGFSMVVDSEGNEKIRNLHTSPTGA